MLKKILIAMSCCMVTVCGASEMDKMVENPIPKIISAYKAEDQTPIAEKTLKDFQNRCREGNFCETLEEYSNISGFKKLQEKWKYATEALETVCGLKKGANENQLREAFNKISDITNNGFYDVSSILLSSVKEEDSIHEKFNTFWQLLLQAEEIVNWYVCTCENVKEEDLPGMCYEAYCMLQRKEETVGDILWAVSILGKAKSAICGLDEEGAPTKETVEQARKEAKVILEKEIVGQDSLSILNTWLRK